MRRIMSESVNLTSSAPPDERPSTTIVAHPGWSMASKSILFLIAVVLFAAFLVVYATQQKDLLLEQFNELQTLHDTEGAIRQTEMAAFRDITEFFLFIDSSNNRDIEQIRPHIQDLQRRQLALTERFPEISPTFAMLSHRLAAAYQNPSAENLVAVRLQLAETRRRLQQLAEQSRLMQSELADRYYERGNRAAITSMMLALVGLAATATLAMIFFTRLTRDIRRVQQRLGEVVRGYRGPDLGVHRNDEFGQLTAHVNQMVRELRERERDLDLERRKSFQKDKMASLGTLAAGIVHEIGNPIAAISGLVESLREAGEDTSASEQVHARLLMIQEQVARLSSIARDVSDFAVPQGGHRELIDLNSLIRNTHRFMRYDRRLRSIDMRLELDTGLPAIYGVSDQLVQLFMNLLINAADAMEGRDGGEPVIAVTSRRLDDRFVLLEVEDNGHGMDEATRKMALDPFFTTKGAGKGTGLGLPLCFTVVSEHGGTLEIDSSVDRGTRIIIKLPIDERTTERLE